MNITTITNSQLLIKNSWFVEENRQYKTNDTFITEPGYSLVKVTAYDIFLEVIPINNSGTAIIYSFIIGKYRLSENNIYISNQWINLKLSECTSPKIVFFESIADTRNFTLDLVILSLYGGDISVMFAVYHGFIDGAVTLNQNDILTPENYTYTNKANSLHIDLYTNHLSNTNIELWNASATGRYRLTDLGLILVERVSGFVGVKILVLISIISILKRNLGKKRESI